MEEKKYILFVDDEAENRLSFKALFRRKYPIFVVEGVAEAIRIIETNNVKIVLSDERMPNMTGLDLMDWLKTYDPRIVRVLVTASISTQQREEALAAHRIHHWIGKPWKVSEMKTLLDQCWALQSALTKNSNEKL